MLRDSLWPSPGRGQRRGAMGTPDGCTTPRPPRCACSASGCHVMGDLSPAASSVGMLGGQPILVSFTPLVARGPRHAQREGRVLGVPSVSPDEAEAPAAQLASGWPRMPMLGGQAGTGCRQGVANSFGQAGGRAPPGYAQLRRGITFHKEGTVASRARAGRSTTRGGSCRTPVPMCC
jgi:hypothetical protein